MTSTSTGCGPSPSAGLRNVLVHAYVDVDSAVVARAVPLALEHYGAYVRQVAQTLKREGRDG